jgi:uncharacterized protein (TIGR03790 family)
MVLAAGWAVLAAMLLPRVAGAGGAEVAVVYNSALPESKQVADYYAQARQIPAGQLFGFPLTTELDMTRTDFATVLQKPLADALEDRGLWKMGDVVIPYRKGAPKHTEHRVIKSQIRYLVLCYGVPLRIREDNDLREFGETNVPVEFRPNTASVDSELAWLPVMGLNPPLFGPLRSWVYGATNETSMTATNGVLLVARLDGPTPQIACGLVDKAMAAERDGLWGRGYFDARGLGKTDRYFYGDKLIMESAEICAEMGFDTVLDTNNATFPASFPLSQIGIYCGWYDGDVSGPFTLPNVEFMPGAFAYHLHSFSAANIRSPTSNWVGPLLAKGATCTMGCVSEPYLNFTPDIAFFLRAWAHGWSFGEAAWAAQPALSWQTTVVGDPLYRPYAEQPLVLHNQLVRRHSPWLEWSYLRLLNLEGLRGVSLDKRVEELEQLDATDQSAVLTEKLADLTAAQGKPDAAIDYFQRALGLTPSPQQRIRLRLTLGSLLTRQNRGAEAADDYRQLLEEDPDYAGKSTIEGLLASLEPKPASLAAHGKP